jgi:Serine/threonine protein phosphatase
LKKKINEDYLLIFEPINEEMQQKGSLYIIADGVGGMDKGEVASKMAAEVIRQSYYSIPGNDIKSSLIAAIKQANREIYQKGSDDERMGTTVVCAVIKDNNVYFANVGDSRGYVFKKGKLKRITEDHSFVWERVKMGELTEEQARTHPRKNVILRCLGYAPEIEVDTFKVQIEKGDKILLCSDGLWDEMPKTDIERTLAALKNSDTALKKLVEKAIANGGNDNISAILLEITEVFVTAEKIIPIADYSKRARTRGALAAVFGAVAVVLIGISAYLLFTFMDFSTPVASIIADKAQGNVPFSVKFVGDFKSDSSKDLFRRANYQWDIKFKGADNKEKDIVSGNFGKEFTYEFKDVGMYSVSLECDDSFRKIGKSEVNISAVDDKLPQVKVKTIDQEPPKKTYWIGDKDSLSFEVLSNDENGISKVELSYSINSSVLATKSFVNLSDPVTYTDIDTKNLDELLNGIDIKNATILTVKARAEDKNGNVSESEPISVNINKDTELPIINLKTIPGAFTPAVEVKGNQNTVYTLEIPVSLNTPYNVPVIVNTVDNVGISKVEMTIQQVAEDGVDKKGPVTQQLILDPNMKESNGTFIWSVLGAGSYKLSFSATDKYGNQSIAAEPYIVKVIPFWKGNFVYADIDISGNSEIFIGSKGQLLGDKNLTNNPANDISPIINEKQNTIYFGSNRDGKYDIFAMDISGIITVKIPLNITQKVMPIAIIDENTIIYRIEGDPNNHKIKIN